MSSTEQIARVGQSLYTHSHNVAERASAFVRDLGHGAAEIAYAVGLLHDIGKGVETWQKYARNGFHKEELHGYQHTVPGARLIREYLPKTVVRTAMEYVVLGHHTGIPDYDSTDSYDVKTVKKRINQKKYRAYTDEALRSCKDLIEEVEENGVVWGMLRQVPDNITPRNMHMWVRLIASALVDADYLDAELNDDPIKAEKRGNYASIPELLEKYNAWCLGHINESDGERGNQRREIRDACIRAALTDTELGIYKLCAPTGSGKTLSSLAFALNHTVRRDKKRIIYVVPYISIIEQTADLFRKIFGEENVIEHHSKYDITQRDNEDEILRYENAIENWDAPIIITTANQFYESCVASGTSKIRKLHNVINSVVVIDEVQALPKHAINTAMGSIKCLSSLANTTFLLMTATMPNYEDYGNTSRQYVVECLDESATVNIISPEQAKAYFASNPPIHYIWTKDTDSYFSIAAEMVNEDIDVLAITNTRPICRTLYDEVLSLVPAEERGYVYHLSNSMCGEHISRLLKEIRAKIKENRVKRLNGEKPIPIRVISTSLVEAGVDLDFPVVYRELAGLDSIIQAAGRCNREGFYPRGKVRVFASLYRFNGGEDRNYPNYIQDGLSAFTEVMYGRDTDELDKLLRNPEFIRAYYTALLRNLPTDLYPELMDKDMGIRFRYVGERFRLIDEATCKVLIHYNT